MKSKFKNQREIKIRIESEMKNQSMSFMMYSKLGFGIDGCFRYSFRFNQSKQLLLALIDFVGIFAMRFHIFDLI